jgi:hypothetical protein
VFWRRVAAHPSKAGARLFRYVVASGGSTESGGEHLPCAPRLAGLEALQVVLDARLTVRDAVRRVLDDPKAPLVDGVLMLLVAVLIRLGGAQHREAGEGGDRGRADQQVPARRAPTEGRGGRSKATCCDEPVYTIPSTTLEGLVANSQVPRQVVELYWLR